MPDFQPIGLGDRAEDPITRFQGIVTTVTRYLTGSVRMGIQPEGLDKEGQPLKMCDYDQAGLVLMMRAVYPPLVIRGAVSGGIGLGDRVQHRVTGLVGIVESVTDWLNGCTRIGVKPEALHEGSTIAREYFDEPELDLMEPGVFAPALLTVEPVAAPAQVAVEPAPAPETRRTNGGPGRATAGFRR